ncbi:MAG: nicotinate (nicotinamide) nucleotide adenylyltransferase [Victivallaceae bacterium]|nr:nicotinate (nicotinamide) nucleotide adenylyltransferase [Victivallaceae bacterium]
MRGVFFGGSFDPPHAGHLAAARCALDSGRCDIVRWVVAFQPPHKATARRAPFSDRLEMVRLLIGKRTDMEVSDLESRLPRDRATFTVDALALYEAEYGEKPSLLIGADSLLTLHTWRSAGFLAEHYEILTYPRPQCRVDRAALRVHWGEKETEKLLAGVFPAELYADSSSEIRECARSGRLGETTTSAALREYIEKQRLYR